MKNIWESKRKPADLRVCASCEWIFSAAQYYGTTCPKCGFGSYAAYSTYGNACYRLKKTQARWLEKKLTQYRSKLLQEIKEGEMTIEEFRGWGLGMRAIFKYDDGTVDSQEVTEVQFDDGIVCLKNGWSTDYENIICILTPDGSIAWRRNEKRL